MKAGLILSTVRKLHGLLSQKHRAYWGVVIILSVGFSLVEMVGVSAILPFIAVISNPEILETGLYARILSFLPDWPQETLIARFGVAIIAFYVFRGLYSVGQRYIVSKFSQAVSRRLAKETLATTLSLPYDAYTQKNLGEVTSIIGEANNAGGISMTIMGLITDIVTIILVYALLVAVNWQVTMTLTCSLVLIVFISFKILIPKNKDLGAKLVEINKKAFRVLQEALYNFKYVKLKGNQGRLVLDYNKARVAGARIGVTSMMINSMPKTILEVLGFSLLVVAIIFISAQTGEAAAVIPVISVFALALYRLLPCSTRLLSSVTDIAFAQNSLEVVAKALKEPVDNEGDEQVSFSQEIALHNLCFSYATGGEVIRDFSLSIAKGEKIAFTGESGGGKSTLIDIVVGLLRPQSGEVAIDGQPLCSSNMRSWRRKIGYIPQNIWLADGTIAENVAYGSERDDERIEAALKKANIWDFLLTKEGIETKVGDSGVQLSGGQKQRVGIARALYDDPEILVLDEATSAL
ncbi:MAG: ABC transporter ATP-binding protein/permease, partial [Treponema sp.]|nr:ABC transporter ATP-binding protein/permease [Treponema sp.]